MRSSVDRAIDRALILAAICCAITILFGIAMCSGGRHREYDIELPPRGEVDDPEPPRRTRRVQWVKRPAHVDSALAYVGVMEEPPGSNRGLEVEQFLGAVGLGGGHPYCAAFVSYVLDAAGVAAPRVRSARARDFEIPTSIPARIVQRGVIAIPPGTIVVWRVSYDTDDPRGHVGVVIAWGRQYGYTVEANTSPGTAGSQRDGGGVWKRRRELSPGSFFRITHFTPVWQ